MFNFQQKRKLKVALESRVTWTILLILAGLMLMSAYDRYLIARDMAERRLEAEQEVAALESRKLELEAEVEYLSHDRGIEAEMRRQFDVAKAGEQVVIIVEDEATTTVVEEMSPLPPEERPWYRFW
jgi:cell division protein FtsB